MTRLKKTVYPHCQLKNNNKLTMRVIRLILEESILDMQYLILGDEIFEKFNH